MAANRCTNANHGRRQEQGPPELHGRADGTSAPGPGGPPAPGPGKHPPAYGQALQAVNQVAELAPDHGGDLGAQFASFASRPMPRWARSTRPWRKGRPELVGDAEEHLKSATHAWLGSLDEQQFQALAAGAGFEHPSLVGLNTKPGHPSALAHWLDPAYPSTSTPKAKIQAKATERYDKLLAGEPVAGMSLADMVAAEQALDKHKPGGAGWVATPEQLHQLQAHLDDIAAKASKAQPAAERAVCWLKLSRPRTCSATLSAPGRAADELAARKAAAKKTATGLGHGSMSELFRQPTGALEVSGARLVNSSEAMALLRHSTPAEVLGPIQAKLAQRQADFEQLKASGQALAPHLPPPAGPASSPLGSTPLRGRGWPQPGPGVHEGRGQWSKRTRPPRGGGPAPSGAAASTRSWA